MGKIYYYYGTMNCGKSARLLQLAHSSKNPFLCKPFFDSRDGNFISSRIVLKKEANLIPKISDMKTLARDLGIEVKNMYFDFNFFVDEAHFCTIEQVESLRYIADVCGANVYCFGLRTNSEGNLFQGTANMFAIADFIEEIPYIAEDEDGNKLIMHLDLNSENSVNGIRVGDVDTYRVVSRKEFYEQFS